MNKLSIRLIISLFPAPILTAGFQAVPIWSKISVGLWVLHIVLAVFARRIRFSTEVYFASVLVFAFIGTRVEVPLIMLLAAVGLSLLALDHFSEVNDSQGSQSRKIRVSEIAALLIGLATALLAAMLDLHINLWIIIPLVVFLIAFTAAGYRMERGPK